MIIIEIKTSTTFSTDFLKGINYWKKINPQTKNAFVVYTGKDATLDYTRIINWKEMDIIKN